MFRAPGASFYPLAYICFWWLFLWVRFAQASLWPLAESQTLCFSCLLLLRFHSYLPNATPKCSKLAKLADVHRDIGVFSQSGTCLQQHQGLTKLVSTMGSLSSHAHPDFYLPGCFCFWWATDLPPPHQGFSSIHCGIFTPTILFFYLLTLQLQSFFPFSNRTALMVPSAL